MNVDPGLLRFRLPELVVARTKSAGDPLNGTGSVQVLGLHPLLTVVIALVFRIRVGVSATIPTTSTWNVTSLARNDGGQAPVQVSGTKLVDTNVLPDAFESASAAPGLQFDFTLSVNGTDNLGEWILTVEACPVDAELVLECPELLRALYAQLKIVPLQGLVILNDPTG